MSEVNLFETAARLKYRYDTNKGGINTEDLWDLPLTTAIVHGTSLDSVARAVHKKIKELEGDSFVVDNTNTASVQELNNKLEIVKHVIAAKKADNEAKLAAKARQSEKERIKEIIDGKKDAQLSEKSIEELEKRLAAL